MMGTIMNIQKYAVHDGPGIRTTVFFKGCPLRCWWCHNPESQKCKHQIMYVEERCVPCGICQERCPQSAITIEDNYVTIDEETCNHCGICTDFCPHNALEYVGRDITVSELMKEIEKDAIFYEESGGGVTFSGGEPMVQVDFLNQVLAACKEKGIHTAVDVSGYGTWADFQKKLWIKWIYFYLTLSLWMMRNTGNTLVYLIRRFLSVLRSYRKQALILILECQLLKVLMMIKNILGTALILYQSCISY